MVRRRKYLDILTVFLVRDKAFDEIIETFIGLFPFTRGASIELAPDGPNRVPLTGTRSLTL